MAETAATIITDALQEILVQASEQPVEASEMQSGIRYLNRMMSEWDALGYPLGFTVITNPSDLVTIPDGAINAVVLNLAIKLAQQYDEPISQSLAMAARDGMQAVQNLSVEAEPTLYPSTLPVGSTTAHYALS